MWETGAAGETLKIRGWKMVVFCPDCKGLQEARLEWIGQYGWGTARCERCGAPVEVKVASPTRDIYIAPPTPPTRAKKGGCHGDGN
jgi:hypothetical protein